MAHDLFPSDSMTLERTMAFGHHFSLVHAQDGSQRRFCWCKARSWCHIPPSTGQPAPPGERTTGSSSLALPRPLRPSHWGECRAWARPGQPNPGATPSSPISAHSGSSREPRVLHSLGQFHCRFPTRASSSHSSRHSYHKEGTLSHFCAHLNLLLGWRNLCALGI